MKFATQLKSPQALGMSLARYLLGALLLYAGTCIATAPILANTETDLLEPERAFQLSGRYKDPKMIELQYKIAEHHYLYRSKFKFAIEPVAEAGLGKAQISKGEMKQDPTFGWVETYRDSVRILVPIATLRKNSAPAGMQPLRLKVTSQGCADAGVCYPPLHQYLTLQPGSLAVVLPEGTPKVGSPKPPLTSTILPSISETLRKPSQP